MRLSKKQQQQQQSTSLSVWISGDQISRDTPRTNIGKEKGRRRQTSGTF